MIRPMRVYRGQALVLALALTILATAGSFLMFRTGETLKHKTRLVNLADAAAHGAAVWRARVLNFNAYSNRAIIAQEVSVAQALTLKSWSRYFARLTHNGARLARAYPPLAAVFDGLDASARHARELSEAAADIEIRLRAAKTLGYKEILQHSQELLTLSAGVFGMSAVANELARANHLNAFAFALPDGGAFSRMTRRYESDSDRARLRDLVERSLDSFTGGPRGVDQVLWGLPASCALSPNRPADWFQMYRKRGGTQLAPGLDRWEAADTGSMHDNARSGFFGFRCRRMEWLPLGWGAAEASVARPSGRIESDPGQVSINPNAFRLAETELTKEARNALSSISGDAAPAGSGVYAGLSRVRELAYEQLSDKRLPRSRIAVLARVGREEMSRNPAVLPVSERLKPDGGEIGARLWALACAEVYFRRPGLRAGQLEYASLYSPYWQARLSPAEPAERLMAEAYVH